MRGRATKAVRIHCLEAAGLRKIGACLNIQDGQKRTSQDNRLTQKQALLMRMASEALSFSMIPTWKDDASLVHCFRLH